MQLQVLKRRWGQLLNEKTGKERDLLGGVPGLVIAAGWPETTCALHVKEGGTRVLDFARPGSDLSYGMEQAESPLSTSKLLASCNDPSIAGTDSNQPGSPYDQTAAVGG